MKSVYRALRPIYGVHITPLDFYLWGYVKSKCFVDKPATIEALEPE